uniref:Gustatory receptor n=1 Tax=Rhodnius prolixus TaxID=13249 RepID=T1H8V2_RHOPR
MEKLLKNHIKIFRYLGICPFELTNHGKLKLLKTSLIYTIVVLLTIDTLYIINLISFLKKISKWNKHQSFVAGMFLILLPLTINIAVVYIITKKTQLESVIKIFVNFKNKFPEFIPETKLKYYPICPTFIDLVIIFVDVLDELVFVEYIPYLYLFGILVFFTRTVIISKSCLVHMQQFLKNKGDVTSLPLILEAHDLILDSCANINSVFGPFLLGTISVSFLYLTIGIYCFTLSHATPLGYIHYTLIVFANLSLLYGLADLCVSTIDDSLQIKQQLTKLVYQDYSRKFDNYRVIVMFQIIQNRNPEFTAYKFFNISFNMIGSIVAVICTYVIILIQFDISVEPQ